MSFLAESIDEAAATPQTSFKDVDVGPAPAPVNPAASPSTSPPSLLSLPPEVRSQIYKHIVACRYNKVDLGDGYSKYRLHLDLFRANRQIYNECREAFRRENVLIKCSTPWPKTEEHVAVEGRVPILARLPVGQWFPGVHMHATIDVPSMLYIAECSFVFCVDDLDAFAQIWFYQDLSYTGMNAHMRLVLQLERPGFAEDSPKYEAAHIPRNIQRRLLIPFQHVKGLYEFRMEGEVDDAVREEVVKLNKIPHDSPEACFDRTAALQEAGAALLKASKAKEALDTYFAAFEAMHIVIHGSKRTVYADAYFDQMLRGGRFDGQHGQHVRIMLRIKLVACVIEAYLATNEMENAKFWGERSIRIMRDAVGQAADYPVLSLPGGKHWGLCFLRTAIACKALGDMTHAREYARIAADWLPESEEAKQLRSETSLKLTGGPLGFI